jgi:hypothetical protein
MSLNTLPGHSRIWIYQSNRPFIESEIIWLEQELDAFTSTWKAHGSPLLAGWEIPYLHFVVLAVDENTEAPSGCSIDTSVHLMRKIETHLGVSLFSRTDIAFLINETVTILSRKEMQEAYAKGVLNEETLMFDHTVTRLEEWRTSWIKPLKESWAVRWIPVHPSSPI